MKRPPHAPPPPRPTTDRCDAVEWNGIDRSRRSRASHVERDAHERWYARARASDDDDDDDDDGEGEGDGGRKRRGKKTAEGDRRSARESER